MIMAKETKVSLDYYPVDVGFIYDDKLLLIRDEFGANSLWYILAIWDRIYGDKGWYTYFDEDSCRLLSQKVGLDVNQSKYLMELVQGCVRRSLFDERVFSMFGILTSKRLQKNYFMAKRENIKKRVAKGVKYKVDQNIFLLNDDDLEDIKMAGFFERTQKYDNSGFIHDNSGFNANNSGIMEQRKEKESKEKESINIYEYIKEGINRELTNSETTLLADLMDEYDPSLICMACREAVLRNKFSMAYVSGILHNWKRSGEDMKLLEGGIDDEY